MDTARAASAILFLQAGMYTMDAMSTLNSSPWTSENFGADATKAASAQEYVWHALGVGTAYCAVSAVIAGSWFPIYGAAVNAGYLWWIYQRALKRGADSGSTNWKNGN
jgi:hypothetical protein